MCNNPNLDLVDINAYTKFGELLSICSEYIERKQNYDGQNDGWNDRQPKSNIAPTFSKQGYKNIERLRFNDNVIRKLTFLRHCGNRANLDSSFKPTRHLR